MLQMCIVISYYVTPKMLTWSILNYKIDIKAQQLRLKCVVLFCFTKQNC